MLHIVESAYSVVLKKINYISPCIESNKLNSILLELPCLTRCTCACADTLNARVFGTRLLLVYFVCVAVWNVKCTETKANKTTALGVHNT